MARLAFGANRNQPLPGGYNASFVGVTSFLGAATAADDAAGTASGTLTTDVAAAVAVLVADGASPTQGHVDTLNTAWALLATAIAATKTATAAAAVAANPADAVLDIDRDRIININALNATVREIMKVAGQLPALTS